MMRRLMMGSIDASYRPESLALFARLTTPPTVLRKVAINTLISALVAGGVWDDLDVLYVFAAANTQAAQLNWKSTSYAAENQGATFTADRGYAGDGVSTYITTSYSPGNGQFAQDDHTFGRWVRTIGVSGGAGLGTVGAAVRFRITGVDSSNVETYDGAITGAKTWAYSSAQDVLVTRSGSTAYDVYRNGSSLGTETIASEALTGAGQFFLLAERNASGSPVSFSDSQISAAYFGKSLTSGKAAILSAALAAYMTAVGA